MNTVHVSASRAYDVRIGAGLLTTLGAAAAELGGIQKAAVVSDSTVWPLFGAHAVKSLSDAGIESVHFVFHAGESSKNGSVYLDLLNFFAENRLTRSDLIIALGGGVTGDLAGFAAATFLRGIRLIQIPTTVLAAVDSSVGGKTAIDLPAGKNLAGAFYQPSLVLCDTDTLATLPDDIFSDGCAEVIKYSVLFDRALFAELLEVGTAFDPEKVITRCVELKRDVVNVDEFDTGARMLLNLGHTIGHGVEAQSNFGISHGKAVAIGMAITARSAAKLGICTKETCCAILEILGKFGLPTATSFSAESLFTSALSDKKRSGGTVNLIVPFEIGLCGIRKTDVSELLSFIKAGL